MSPQEEEELLEMFSFEAQEMHQQLNELLTSYEADGNKDTLEEIFRITHTLKGSALGMGFVGIADISHVVEEIFVAIRGGELVADKTLFTSIYKANDKLGELIANIRTKEKISHKGIKTKLEVILRKVRESNSQTEAKVSESPAQNPQPEDIPNPIEEESENTNGYNMESTASQKEIESDPDDTESGGIWDKIMVWIKNLLNSNKTETLVPTEDELKDEGGEENTSNFLDHQDFEATSDTPIVAQDHSFQPATFDPEEGRPSLTSSDENSVLELLQEPGVHIVEENQELIKGLQDKVAITDSVQVPIRKLDNLLNQVGQLIIERDRLMATITDHGRRSTEYAGLQRITSDLQYSVMDVRLVQIGTLFNKFHRVARDVASIEKKDVQLKVKGTEVEIDRNILKTMSDSMVHLIRNAVSHGVESAEERTQLGKPKEATITLNARSEKDYVVIEVTDDGRGIDPLAIRKKVLEKDLATKEYLDQMSDDEVIMFIFEPGFSNAAQVNEISGRGVGMDVVKNSTESIGGQIFIDTEVGKGTTISLRLPSSMAVKGVLLFQMGEQEYAFALAYTEAVISLCKKDIHKAGIGLMSSYLKQTISVVFFSDLLNMKDFSEVYEPGTLHQTFDECDPDKKFDVIVISYADKYIGIVVDKLLQQKEIIEKTIPKPLDNNRLMSGTTILGNGHVCLVADVAAIADILYRSKLKVHEAKKVS